MATLENAIASGEMEGVVFTPQGVDGNESVN
jgi:hypothetical protein